MPQGLSVSISYYAKPFSFLFPSVLLKCPLLC